MKAAVATVLALLASGCAKLQPDDSLVPPSVPPEARPVWAMLAAAQTDDTARLMSVCTPDKRKDIAACNQHQRQRMFQEVRELVPQGGIGELKLTVCRRSFRRIRLKGCSGPKGCGDLVTRDGPVFVLVGGKTAVPVTRYRGVWRIEGRAVRGRGVTAGTDAEQERTGPTPQRAGSVHGSVSIPRLPGASPPMVAMAATPPTSRCS